LTPLVYGEPTDEWRDDFFCEHLFDQPRIPKWEGVRGKRYVYARYFEHLPQGEFLHDLEQDPLELQNLVGDPASADVLTRMRARCDQLVEQYGGQYSLERFSTTRALRKQNQEKAPSSANR
jgi:hypothetical protein